MTGDYPTGTAMDNRTKRITLATLLTLVIMYVVPFPIYGALSLFAGLQPPTQSSPIRFVLSVLVVKTGASVAFVALFYIAREIYLERWKRYALVWWVMFAVMEVGQAITTEYSWLDAAGGIVAEAIYFPLAAYTVKRVLCLRTDSENQTATRR